MTTILHLTPWQIHTSSLRALLTQALSEGQVTTTDAVWRASDGSVIVAAYASDLDGPEYADYLDAGTVAEYLDVDTTANMLLSDADRQALAADDMTDVHVVRVNHDLQGYPDRLLCGRSLDEITDYLGWWYHGESVTDIKWREA